MSLQGPSAVTVGDSVQINVMGDFSGEGLIAGGITLFWQPAFLQLNTVELTLPVMPDFGCPGASICPPATANSVVIVWAGIHANLIEPDDPAPTLMATLNYTATDTVTQDLLFLFGMQSNTQLTGGWFGADFRNIDSPSFGNFAVPLPAGIWLLLGGLATLPGVRRQVIT